jgi:hypothetical protein
MAPPTHADAESVKDHDKDLNEILSAGERVELTLLIANVTEIMGKQIRDTFNASITSTTQPPQIPKTAGKPSNESATQPHKETEEEEKARKLLERREKELSEPKMLELKLEALKFFDQWRESVISRVGDAVNNSKEVVDEQKQNASVDETPDTAAPPEPQVIRKAFTSSPYLLPVLYSDNLHSTQHEHGRSRCCIDGAVPAHVYTPLLSPARQESATASLHAIISAVLGALHCILSNPAPPHLVLPPPPTPCISRARGEGCTGPPRGSQADEWT